MCVKFQKAQQQSNYSDQSKRPVNEITTSCFQQYTFLKFKKSYLFFIKELIFLENFNYSNIRGIRKVFGIFVIFLIVFRSQINIKSYVPKPEFVIPQNKRQFRSCKRFSTHYFELFFQSDIIYYQDTLNQIITQTKQDFFDTFYNSNNFKEGKEELNKITEGRFLSESQTFQLGLYLGVNSCLLFLIIIAVSQFEIPLLIDEKFLDILPLFRSQALLIIYMVLFSINVYGWNMGRINYKLLFNYKMWNSTYFEVNTQYFLLIFQILNISQLFVMIFLLMLSWYFILHGQFKILTSLAFLPQELCPLVVWIMLFAYFLLPRKKWFNAQGRTFLLNLIKDIFSTPCLSIKSINFRLIWAANQMTSFIIPLRDFQYVICYYWNKARKYDLSTPHTCNKQGFLSAVIISSIPLLIRQIQIMKQYYKKTSQKESTFYLKWNFWKYTFALITVILNYLVAFDREWLKIWFIFALVSTVYSYVWDIKFDWQLFQKNPRIRFLRNLLSYKHPSFYYIAIIINLIFRLVWTLNLSQVVLHLFWNSDTFCFLIGFLEMVRICIWNFFRVEVQQHIKNQECLKAVNNINLPYDIDDIEIDNDEILKIDLIKLKNRNFNNAKFVFEPFYQKYHKHRNPSNRLKNQNRFLVNRMDTNIASTNIKSSSNQIEQIDIKSTNSLTISHQQASYADLSSISESQINQFSPNMILQDNKVFPILKQNLKEMKKMTSLISDIKPSKNKLFLDQIFDVKKSKGNEKYTKSSSKKKSQQVKSFLGIKQLRTLQIFTKDHSPLKFKLSMNKIQSFKQQQQFLDEKKGFQEEKENVIKQRHSIIKIPENKLKESLLNKANKALDQLLKHQLDDLENQHELHILKQKYSQYEQELIKVVKQIIQQSHDDYFIKLRPQFRQKRKLKLQ